MNGRTHSGHRPHVANTPPLLKRMGVPESPEFRFPKLLMGMTGVEYSDRQNVKTACRAQLDRSRFLRFITPIIATGAIHRDGIDRNHVFRATHSKLAAMMGYRCRESYTRMSGRAPQLVRREVKHLVKGSLYAFTFGESESKRYGRTDFTMPSAKEMRENEEFEQYWREARKEYKGYTWIPAWIFHPETPGTPYQKLVLLALALLGLFTLDDEGHCKGEIQFALQTIGNKVGLSRDAVRSALAFYQKLGLVQVKEHEGHFELNGNKVPAGTAGAKWVQPPNTIYYIAGREFDQETAQTEMNRFLRVAKPIREDRWFEVAAGLHGAILREWCGTRQMIKTFYAECRKRMIAASVPAHLIELLIPRPPQ